MKQLLLLTCCLISLIAFAQKTYWQQQANYIIDVTLNDKDHSLDAFEKITYTNNAPDTLTYIWFHVWPNAYKNDKTAFTDQELENGRTAFYFATKEQRGYINRLDFKVDGLPAKTADHPNYIDVIKLVLPRPLPPQQKITITTPFHVKLPHNFSRGGHVGKSYQITQWYPKPAVYDATGWHEMPYLDQGEFYSEFGSFDVRITLPKDYVVAATGDLQNEEERKWLLTKSIALQNINESKPKNTTTKKNARPATTKPAIQKPVSKQDATQTVGETKTLRYLQNNVHDFAWFADKNFIVNYDTCQLASGKKIDVFTYYPPQYKNEWKKSTDIVKDAIRFYGSEVGEYPYHVVSAVQGPQGFGGGMEYPTITLIAPMPSEKALSITITHEVGHNWFYGILGSNERQHPWMDEGVNSFYEYKFRKNKNTEAGVEDDLLLKTKIAQKLDQPIETTAADFSFLNYELVAYHKTAKWLQLMEQTLGEEKFREAMHLYFTSWQFRHPQPADFQAAFAPYLKEKTNEYFSLLQAKGHLPAGNQKALRMATPFSIKKYINNPSDNLLLITPAIGNNRYDGIMLGAAITNYKLPPNKFQFIVVPLYSTHAKKFSVAANMRYNIFTDQFVRQISFSMGAMQFSKRGSLDTNNNKVFERFQRITPSVRMVFKEMPRSTRLRTLELKSFIIKESNFDKFVTKSTDGLYYVDSLKNSHRTINQLSFTQQDARALYPYDYQLQIQQGKGFYRINFTSNYFFNYANGGGLGMRLFAGKFGYLGNEADKFSSFYYRPKLLGVRGEEDYTYSNYFMGRTASESNTDDAVVKNKGLPAHQIMIRDGAFKLRFAQYEFLQGRSEKWVAATNFTTTIPKKILPLVPLKVFLDIGTYAEAWDRQSTTSHFLYVGGFQLSLLHDIINIYAPFIYSNEFKDYIKIDKETFFKRMSFSIDLQQINFHKLTRGAISF